MQSLQPGFAKIVPYTATIIEMEGRVRLVSWVVDCPPEELHLGQEVKVFFDDVTEEVVLPKFRRVDGQS
jgi:uncharacterized protein